MISFSRSSAFTVAIRLEAETHSLSSNKDVIALARVAHSRIEGGMLVVRLLVMLMRMRSSVMLM